MNVFGHDYIACNHKFVSLSHSFQS
jgi:hypothetical protein